MVAYAPTLFPNLAERSPAAARWESGWGEAACGARVVWRRSEEQKDKRSGRFPRSPPARTHRIGRPPRARSPHAAQRVRGWGAGAVARRPRREARHCSASGRFRYRWKRKGAGQQLLQLALDRFVTQRGVAWNTNTRRGGRGQVGVEARGVPRSGWSRDLPPPPPPRAPGGFQAAVLLRLSPVSHTGSGSLCGAVWCVGSVLEVRCSGAAPLTALYHTTKDFFFNSSHCWLSSWVAMGVYQRIFTVHNFPVKYAYIE